MKKYQVQLTNGQAISLVGVENFDADGFTALLNNREILFVNIAGSVINKNVVLCVIQVPDSSIDENINIEDK